MEKYLYELISDPPPEFDLLSRGRDRLEYTEDDVTLATRRVRLSRASNSSTTALVSSTPRVTVVVASVHTCIRYVDPIPGA